MSRREADGCSLALSGEWGVSALGVGQFRVGGAVDRQTLPALACGLRAVAQGASLIVIDLRSAMDGEGVSVIAAAADQPRLGRQRSMVLRASKHIDALFSPETYRVERWDLGKDRPATEALLELMVLIADAVCSRLAVNDVVWSAGRRRRKRPGDCGEQDS